MRVGKKIKEYDIPKPITVPNWPQKQEQNEPITVPNWPIPEKIPVNK